MLFLNHFKKFYLYYLCVACRSMRSVINHEISPEKIINFFYFSYFYLVRVRLNDPRNVALFFYSRGLSNVYLIRQRQSTTEFAIRNSRSSDVKIDCERTEPSCAETPEISFNIIYSETRTLTDNCRRLWNVCHNFYMLRDSYIFGFFFYSFIWIVCSFLHLPFDIWWNI